MDAQDKNLLQRRLATPQRRVNHYLSAEESAVSEAIHHARSDAKVVLSLQC
jgi:hypothetical protein